MGLTFLRAIEGTRYLFTLHFLYYTVNDQYIQYIYIKYIFICILYTIIYFYFQTSYLWYSAIGCMLTMLVGVVVSFITGAQNPADIDQDFLSPPIAAMFRMQTKPCAAANRVQGIVNLALEPDEKPQQVDICKSPQ